ncbi:Hypothetical predicted protein [Octopus vulgaris]|uniref:Uncharacterized protein n=1 Tax=Octopus vulgaris TaxID=6645 RepID=A0AA36FI61_OCTVU|nr:Hypothetical predicted protein [Octopus vulgaris]
MTMSGNEQLKKRKRYETKGEIKYVCIRHRNRGTTTADEQSVSRTSFPSDSEMIVTRDVQYFFDADHHNLAWVCIKHYMLEVIKTVKMF